MNAQILFPFFQRDLEGLKKEVLQFTNDAHLWKIEGEIKNSAGNLALHLLGNLNYFIGTILGNTGYIRNREAEFSLKDVARDEIISNIDKTIAMLEKVLPEISEDTLSEAYPIEAAGRRWQTYEFLIHLATHLSYHLGQVNYHRRLLDVH